MLSSSQKIETSTFPADFCTRKFWGGLSRYAFTPVIVALSHGHSDITRFSSVVTIVTGNHLDRAEKIAQNDQMTGTLDFFVPLFNISGPNSRRASSCNSSWMMDPTRSREIPSYSAVDLAEIRRSFKISSWIWSIISGVVPVLGRPRRSASRLEKSPRLNWATQFLKVAYHGACSWNVSFRMAWISLSALHCRKKNWWKLASRCCWNRACRHWDREA